MDATPTAAAAPVRKDYHFEFTGNAGEYFRIWIVNILLTIVTLGLYSAWAKVRNNRYFYGNTVLDGSAFEYTADPVRIFKGRLIAVALILIYNAAGLVSWQAALAAGVIVMLLFPALVVMSMRFRMRYSSWRNIQFSFRPNYKRAYMLFGVPILLMTFVLFGYAQIDRMSEEFSATEEGQALMLDGSTIEEDLLSALEENADEEVELSPEEQQRMAEFEEKMLGIVGYIYIPLTIFWLLYPWWLRHYYNFMAENSRYGNSHFAFIGTAAEFYAIYILASLISIPFFIGVAVFGAIFGAFLGESVIAMSLLVGIAMVAPMMAVNAYIQTKKTNIIYSGLTLENIGFTSDLKFGKMFWLYFSNTFAILLSLGLMIPWAKIRMARYRAECMTLYAADFDDFQARINQEQGAQAAEFSDVMDFDLGL